MAVATIEFTPVTGIVYVIFYKKSVDTAWTLAPGGNHVTSSPFTINGLESNIWYDFKIESECGTVTLQGRGQEVILLWVVDTYTCAQDQVFTQISQVTGLSSPRYSYYYAPLGRHYVMDQDDIGGVLWWFDPNTFSSASGRNYVSGSDVLQQCYFAVPDREYKRLYATGYYSPGPGGLMVYDIAADNLTIIPYGSNGSSSFSRVTISVEGNNIYCGDRSNGTITIIARDTLTVTSTLNLTSIPAGPGGKKISANARLTAVNGEIWVWEDGEVSGTNNLLLRYDIGLTTFLGSIDTSAYRSTWNTGYWGAPFFDAEKNIYYGTDVGSANIIAINTTTNTIQKVINIANREGFNNASSVFVRDPVTQDIYIAVQCTNTSPTPNTRRTYKLNRDNINFEHVYPGLYFQQLERVGTTNFLYGTDPGQPRWNGGSWDIDGIVTKFSR